jgi:DNA polymerase III subunit delta'
VAFSDIIGHKEVIKTLQASLADAKTGHAYLFLGPAGLGKKTLAREFAASLLCPVYSGDCSDECPSCRQFRRGLHPDFIPIVSSGNSIKIEQLRELKHNAYLRPVLGARKVFFFPEAEQLTEAAANSFLKILEDPPPGVVFLFTAVRADNILPTIQSRCQIYQLFPVPSGEIVAWLKGKGLTEREAVQRGLDCHGIPGAALESTEEPVDPHRIKFADIMGQDLLQLFKVANDLEKKERRQVLVLLQEWEAQLRINIIQVAQSSGGATAKIAELLYCSEKLAQVIMMVENNVNLRLVVEEFFLSLKVHAKGSLS